MHEWAEDTTDEGRTLYTKEHRRPDAPDFGLFLKPDKPFKAMFSGAAVASRLPADISAAFPLEPVSLADTVSTDGIHDPWQCALLDWRSASGLGLYSTGQVSQRA